MRIGLFTDDFLPRASGITSSILSLRLGLESLGHEVYIIAPKVRGYQDNDPTIIRIPSINPLIFDKGRLAVPMPRTIKRIIDLELDIVHSHTQFTMSIVADYVAKKSGAPHITTAHTIWSELVRHYPWQFASGFGFLTLLHQIYFMEDLKVAMPSWTSDSSMKRLVNQQMWYAHNILFNNVDLVIVPSQHMAKIIQAHGMTTELKVVPNGINVDFFKGTKTRRLLDGDRMHIVCVGRVSPEKRQDVLIRALVQVPNAHLSLIGDGPSVAEFKHLARNLGVDNRVTFYGSRDQEFVRKILLHSDIFALASYKFDSQAIVLIEAQAAGLPVVICDPALRISTSASASMLTGQKAADFARVFKQLQKNPDQLKKMSQAAKITAVDFDHVTYAQNILTEYNKLRV